MSADANSLLIAGGGTGGHVFPALAVAREWLRRGERSVVFVGTERGMEARLVPQAGMPLETIRVAGLKGIGGAKFLRNVAMLPAGLWDSEKILRRHRFGAALGVGGYASGPMMLLAAMHRIPSVVFEPNVEPGFTNRVLAGLATRIAVAQRGNGGAIRPQGGGHRLPGAQGILRDPAERASRALHDYSSRAAAAARCRSIARWSTRSTGWRRRKNQLFIVHQTGERDYNAVRVAYARREFQAEVVPFIENMAERFAQADLIVCRSGAITVAEVSASGRAAIFIPFGASTDAHQTRNAQVMQSAGAARLLPQDELTPERLTTEIFSLLDQPRRIRRDGRSRALARPPARRRGYRRPV